MNIAMDEHEEYDFVSTIKAGEKQHIKREKSILRQKKLATTQRVKQIQWPNVYSGQVSFIEHIRIQ